MNAFSARKISEFVRLYWPEQNDIPKHEKLSNAFTRSIMDGYWASGARLPTEAELVNATPCSLGTIQRALRNLVSAGFIERRRGSGSVVANLSHPMEEPWHMRFLVQDDGGNEYLPVYTKVLGRRITNEVGPWSVPIGQGDQKVVKIDRVMVIADEFEVYNVFYALADRFPELVDLPITDLNGANLKNLMARGHHLVVHKIRQLMRFETPPKWVTSKCKWPTGATASILNTVAFSLDGQVMYYQDYYVPPTKRTLDLGTPTRS